MQICFISSLLQKLALSFAVYAARKEIEDIKSLHLKKKRCYKVRVVLFHPKNFLYSAIILFSFRYQ